MLGSWQNSSLVAGELHTCAIYTTGGDLRCWGHNGWGQLGLDNILNQNAPSQLSPVAFGNSLKAQLVAAGTFHTCALLSDGQVRCWGENDFGQVGLGYTSIGAKKYVGGDAASTPDKLASIRVLP